MLPNINDTKYLYQRNGQVLDYIYSLNTFYAIKEIGTLTFNENLNQVNHN